MRVNSLCYFYSRIAIHFVPRLQSEIQRQRGKPREYHRIGWNLRNVSLESLRRAVVRLPIPEGNLDVLHWSSTLPLVWFSPREWSTSNSRSIVSYLSNYSRKWIRGTKESDARWRNSSYIAHSNFYETASGKSLHTHTRIIGRRGHQDWETFRLHEDDFWRVRDDPRIRRAAQKTDASPLACLNKICPPPSKYSRDTALSRCRIYVTCRFSFLQQRCEYVRARAHIHRRATATGRKSMRSDTNEWNA